MIIDNIVVKSVGEGRGFLMLSGMTEERIPVIYLSSVLFQTLRILYLQAEHDGNSKLHIDFCTVFQLTGFPFGHVADNP